MTCICGHPRGWHRVQDLVRLVRQCHSWGCVCDRFVPNDQEDEPGTRLAARGRGLRTRRGVLP